MEGGKAMKTRLIMKSIFVVILTVILVSLIIIICDVPDKKATMYSELAIVDYTIEDTNEVCPQALELIYSDKKYDYYLPCIKSGDIYLNWTNGERDLLKNAINNQKVTINSLIDHGLRVYKYEK